MPKSDSEVHLQGIVQSRFKPLSNGQKELRKIPRGDQQKVIANQYADSDGARKFASNLAEQPLSSSAQALRQGSGDPRTVMPVVIQNPLNQLVELGPSEVIRQPPRLNSPLVEPDDDYSFSRAGNAPESEPVTEGFDEFVSADDFFGSQPFGDSPDEFDSATADVQPSARSPVEHDSPPQFTAEFSAQTEAKPGALFHSNQFASSVDNQSAPAAASNLTNGQNNPQQPNVATESNDFQPAYPPREWN